MIDQYKEVVAKEETDPITFDLFLEMIKISLRSIETDPRTAKNLLYTLTKSRKDLARHFK